MIWYLYVFRFVTPGVTTIYKRPFFHISRILNEKWFSHLIFNSGERRLIKEDKMEEIFQHTKDMKKDKKGQLGNLQGIVLTLVVVGILIGAAFFILEEFKSQSADISDDGENSSAYEGINKTIDAMDLIPGLLGLIVLIAVIGIILAVVFNVIPGARVSQA